MNGVVAACNCKRTAIAAKEIICCWLCVATIVAIAVHVGTVCGAIDKASGSLSVDSQRCAVVVSPDLIDVVVPICRESTTIDAEVLSWRQNTKRTSTTVGNTELIPGLTIRFSLSGQCITDLTDCTGSDTVSSRHGPGSVRQAHAKRQADKVDVAQIGVQAQVGDVGKLNEAPIDGSARVTRVDRRRFDQRWAITALNSVEFEISICEPNTSSRDVTRKGNLRYATLWAEWNCDAGIDDLWYSSVVCGRIIP